MNRAPELFQGLSAGEAENVRALGALVQLAPGEVLFRLGGMADRLYVVERGLVELTLPMHVGDQTLDVPVEQREAGQGLGWSALIAPHRFTLTAKALVETVVLGLPREALQAYFDANPNVGLTVTRNVASIVGQRLQVIQTMWLREMQRVITLTYA